MRSFKCNYKDSVHISESDYEKAFVSLGEYTDHICRVVEQRDYSAPEASVLLPTDKDLLLKVQDTIRKKKTEKLRCVLVIGIGGSNLGTKAIYEALRPDDDPYPRMFFSDTVSTDDLNTVLHTIYRKVVNKEQLLIIVVSKSGTTTETIANFEIIYSACSERFGDLTDRIVAITNEESPLALRSQGKEIHVLPIPREVGGRYSVFSPVGLLPLGLVNIDLESLLLGAQSMRDKCCLDDPHDNPARMSAVLTYLHYKKGAAINNLFLFNPETYIVGKWYRQLLAESIGKEKDTKGEPVHNGMLPIVSIGSTDLHSIGQHFFGGPRNIFTSMVYFEKSNIELRIPEHPVLDEIVPGVAGKTAHQIMDAILAGVKSAYKKSQLPFIDITLEEVCEYTLGQFMQFKMLEVMYLGQLMDVNVFNQPSVELYKEETRKILEQ